MTSQVSTTPKGLEMFNEVVLPSTSGQQQPAQSFSFTLDDAKPNVAAASDSATVSTPEQAGLSALNQKVLDLSGYHQRQRTALASSMTEELVNNTLAPMAQCLDLIQSAVPQVVQIFKTVESYTPTAETFQKAHELLASIQEQLTQFSAEAKKFNGKPAINAVNQAEALSGILSELAKSPSIDPDKQQIAPLADPFEPLIVTLGQFDYSKGGLSSISTPEPIAQEDFNRAVAQSRLERLSNKFSELVQLSQDNPIEIDLKIKALDNKSVQGYLTERHAALVETIARTSKELSDSEGTMEADTATMLALNEHVVSINREYSNLEQQVSNNKAEIQHLESIQESTPATTQPSTTSATNNKSRQLIARAKDGALKLVARFRKTEAPETSTAQPVSAPPTASLEALDRLKNTVASNENKNEELAASFQSNQSLLKEKYAALIQLENSIELLKETLLGAKEQLQKALLDSCKNLSFKAPKEVTDPVTEALLDISVPKTQNPIPSLSSITESLTALGATTDLYGATSFTDPTTGQTLTMARRSAHGLDANLTITDKDGKQLASDVIWNHHLAEVVEHFKKTGEAPVQSRDIAEWTVSEQPIATKEADAPIHTVAEAVGLSEHAQRVVAYLKDKLEQAGLTVTLSSRNAIDVGDQNHTVTAILNPHSITWSLRGALDVANLTAVVAITTIKDFFNQKPAESSPLASEPVPDEATTPETSHEPAASSITPAAQTEGSPAAETPEPAPNNTEQPEEASNETEKDKLTEEVVQAWNAAPAFGPFSFELSDEASIEVQNTRDSYITTLRRPGNNVQGRTNDNVEQSLRIMVGKYLQDR